MNICVCVCVCAFKENISKWADKIFHETKQRKNAYIFVVIVVAGYSIHMIVFIATVKGDLINYC